MPFVFSRHKRSFVLYKIPQFKKPYPACSLVSISIKKCLEGGNKNAEKRSRGEELLSYILDDSLSSENARLQQTLNDAFAPGSKKYKQSII